MTKVLFSSQGAQVRQQEPEIIRLAPDYGVSLSWLGAGETIKKVWLDNPSFLVMDADGCLEGLNQGCTGEANVLHLRRIEPLNLPNIPSTNHSLLTVITENNGQGGFYIFKIVKSNTPHHLVYKVLDPPSPSRNTQSNFYTTLNRGIRVARREGYLIDGSELDIKLSILMSELQTGGDLEAIAREQNVSTQIINRLIQLSQQTNEI